MALQRYAQDYRGFQGGPDWCRHFPAQQIPITGISKRAAVAPKTAFRPSA